ncbi:MAG: Efflux ABC transporter, ATP-binding protein, partial [uncultured Rubrobacteraceae bacterium]
ERYYRKIGGVERRGGEQVLRDRDGPRRRFAGGGGGRGLRASGPERRGQDDPGEGSDHAPQARRGPRLCCRLRRGTRRPKAAAEHRARRPVRRRGREPDRQGEPRDGRQAVPPPPQAGPPAGKRRSGTVRPVVRGGPGRRRLLGRDAPPARPRGEPGRGAPGALSRRADHGARPGQPQRDVGGHRGARRRRDHDRADHPVLGGGRPARRAHRRHRRRTLDRPGYHRGAEEPPRWRAAGGNPLPAAGRRRRRPRPRPARGRRGKSRGRPSDAPGSQGARFDHRGRATPRPLRHKGRRRDDPQPNPGRRLPLPHGAGRRPRADRGRARRRRREPEPGRAGKRRHDEGGI